MRSPAPNAATTCACPRRRAKNARRRTDGSNRFHRPESAGWILETRSSPSMLAPGPEGLQELSVSPEGVTRRQSRTGQSRNGRKGSPFPSSGLSAAPAMISRHRFHLCRAVAMFDSGPSRRGPQTRSIAGSRRGCKRGWGKPCQGRELARRDLPGSSSYHGQLRQSQTSRASFRNEIVILIRPALPY
jgi:hypothetical protein